jgi:7,8-dihydroneopterin aldolase/epimerase/oxygenase
MDRIEIRGLRAHGHHGVFADERRHGQVFVVDLVLECDLRVPAASDALTDTTDYGALATRVADAVAGTRFDLLEALAGHLAELVLASEPVHAVSVRVSKPDAPLAVEADEVAVVLRRTRTDGGQAGDAP